MTLELALVFFILFAAIVLFFTAWVRMDVVALFVIVSLTITGLVSAEQAIAGFSNPAVITVWAMFILSAAFYQTGVAQIIGTQILRFAGKSEWRVILLIMLTSGMLSSVMNNIGVAALMLPVVMDIARSTERSPSRLLLPLAAGTHLGGLTTLIGTPPNILISVNLDNAGYGDLGLFDFTPVGLGVMLGGTLFVAFIGRFFLISGIAKKANNASPDKILTDSYHLQERTFLIQIKPGSQLNGKTLAESKFRPALGVNVISVKRKGGGTILNPGPDTLLRVNDELFVQGRFDTIKDLQNWKIYYPRQKDPDTEKIEFHKLSIYEAAIGEGSPLLGSNPGRFIKDLTILAIRKNETVFIDEFHNEKITQNDVLLLQGNESQLAELTESKIFEKYEKVSPDKLNQIYQLEEKVMFLEMSEVSELLDQAKSESSLGDVFGLRVIGIIRNGENLLVPESGEKFLAGDKLLILINSSGFAVFKGLLGIGLPDYQNEVFGSLENANMMMAEVVLAPRSLLSGKTLREINFRKKYGLTALALWREGRAFRTNIHNIPLRDGEVLLIYGTREKIALMGGESDFILLTDALNKPLRTNKALTATLIMAGILIPVILGYIPIAISAILGVALMVVTGCLKMEEAYRAIEWRSVFLIAGMLPLGVAMQQSGAAELLTGLIGKFFAPYGPWGILTGLYLITVMATLALHPAAIVVIMSPIVLQSAENFSISPQSLMIAISIAASASFLSPVSHPVNLLVMGPGGYKFIDFIKFGLPLVLIVMAIVFLLIPIFWPL